MTSELQELLIEVAESNWESGASDRLARGIEERIVAFLPGRAKVALGSEEAAQRARVVAWERCRTMVERGLTTATWGYLANIVRWRLADSVRAEALRRQRHPLTQVIPERVDERALAELGPLLDLIAVELARLGLPEHQARRLLYVATEGARFERSAIRSRLLAAGVARSEAEGLAWLLRGGAANPSAVARLASGQPRTEVFGDPLVRRWLAATAGLDLTFDGGRFGNRGAAMFMSSTAAPPGPGLARTA